MEARIFFLLYNDPKVLDFVSLVYPATVLRVRVRRVYMLFKDKKVHPHLSQFFNKTNRQTEKTFYTNMFTLFAFIANCKEVLLLLATGMHILC